MTPKTGERSASQADGDDVLAQSATELRERYRDGDLSPVEVVEAILTRIDRLDDELRAFSAIDPDRARAQARAAERSFARGERVASLAGIPVSVKDVLHAHGLRTTFGSPIFGGAAPDVDDELAVGRLRAAGAIVIGKTNVPELGFGPGTQNPLVGVTRNPWDPRLTPSSSSGGSAVAVASGMGPVSIGSDGGGSIRVPASICGVVGFKPSFGRVPLYPNARSSRVPVTAGFDTLDAVGPLARTVADVALVMDVVAGAHPLDRHSFDDDGATFLADDAPDLTGLRIGFTFDLGDGPPIDPEVRTTVEQVARTLADLGAQVEPDGPRFSDPERTFLATVALELGAFRSFVAEHRESVNERVRSIVDQPWTFDDAAAAVAGRRALVDELRRVFERQDLLLTPTAPAPAFPVERPYPDRIDGRPIESAYVMGGFAAPFNLTGSPAISVPGGTTSTGLPLGVQLVGPRLGDRDVLRAARALEVARPWPRVAPIP